VGGKGGALAGGAKEYKPLVRGKDRLVILAFGIDPEFQHSAGTMECARHAPFSRKLANIAQIDEYNVVTAVQGYGFCGREAFDLALCSFDQCVDMGCNILGHRLFSMCGALIEQSV
jgi:hypothetical protein